MSSIPVMIHPHGTARLRQLSVLILASLLAIHLTACSLPVTPACTTDYLISQINLANSSPATTDVIELVPGCVYMLDKVDNFAFGASGLPEINSPIVINGHGATISRDQSVQERFRLIYISSGGSLEINTVDLLGGYAYDPANPNNVPSNSGGAINNAGFLFLHRCLVKENSAREGGGVFNSGTMEISYSTIDSNHDYFGGPWGAGLHNIGTGSIHHSAITRNGVPEFADGMFNGNAGDLEISNCTFSRNGGVAIDNEGGLTINHVTFAQNGAGGIQAASGNVSIINSLCADDCCQGAAVHPLFPNIDTDGSCNGFTVPLPALHLAPLGHYGGLTETHALLLGSAAIDRVVRECLPDDQREKLRPFGPQCDLGAFEYRTSTEPLVSATESPTPTSHSRTCLYSAALNLFCRSGPGASLYPDLDSFTAGQTAEVVAGSPDGNFVYVNAPNVDGVCVVPVNPRFGELEGDCDGLVVYTPPPPVFYVPETGSQGQTEPETEPEPEQTGCTVLQRSGGLICEVPCPRSAVPGNPCTP